MFGTQTGFDNLYLRVDGGNSMAADLTFDTDGAFDVGQPRSSGNRVDTFYGERLLMHTGSTGSLSVTGNVSFFAGFTTQSGSGAATIGGSTGTAAGGLAAANASSGAATVNVVGEPGFAAGYAASDGTSTATISCAGIMPAVFGYAQSSLSAAALVRAGSLGTHFAPFCHGYAITTGTGAATVEALNSAAFAQGLARTASGGAIVRAGGAGNDGAFCHAIVDTGTGFGIASATGFAAVVMGGVGVTGGFLLATGRGAGAFGYVDSGSSLSASAQNSFQFGPGANTQALSLTVGNIAASTGGVRLIGGGAPTTPVNGDVWKTSGIIELRSDGVTWPFDQLAALTIQDTTITHTAPTPADFAIQDFVDAIGGAPAAAWCFADQDEANTVLQVIRNLQIRLDQVETRLQTFGLLP